MSIKIVVKNNSGEEARIKIKDINRFYDAGSELGIKLTKEQIVKILEQNPHIAFDTFLYGDDTLAGGDFFEALVETVTGRKWSLVKQIPQIKEIIKFEAHQKGYTVYK